MKAYMDNNATTSLNPAVLEEMLPYYKEIYGNPSSKFYEVGRKAETALYELRQRVAVELNAKANEVYFTASGCEADNWAIKGVAFANKNKGNHIITTKIEHHAIYLLVNFWKNTAFPLLILMLTNLEKFRQNRWQMQSPILQF